MILTLNGMRKDELIAHLEAIADIDNKCITVRRNGNPLASLQNLQSRDSVLQQERENGEIRVWPNPLSFRGGRARWVVIHAHKGGVIRILCKVLREGCGAKS